MKTLNLLKKILILIILTFSFFTFNKSANAEEIEPGIRALMEDQIQRGLYEDEDLDLSIFKKNPNELSYSAAEEKKLKIGEFYFSGNYPDSFGHGVGLSQWGAYGAALKGWNAEKILTFYYTNTAIETREDKNVDVEGFGVMSIEDYLADLGEVPSKACGSQKQLEDQAKLSTNSPIKEKYIQDNPNSIFDCWPEEAIKAQIIAARSYAITNTQPICTTTYCQVYYPNNKKKSWAAYETKGKYIISKGSTSTNDIVRAFYSSNNNNGFGTADSDTIWSDKFGNATHYSYLRSVLDNEVNYDVEMNRSKWKTNSYTLKELNEMLSWCSANCPSKDWMQKNVSAKIGNLKSISTIGDNSNRVKKVKLSGEKGEAEIAGWFFTQIFNLWNEKNNPSGKNDEIPSLTFSFKEVMPTCVDSTPLYRFWSEKKQGHFFTKDEFEKNSIINNDSSWKYEGIAYCVYGSQINDSMPIYRFWSEQKQKHFFTIDEFEKNSIINNDSSWKYEGIAFYADTAKKENNSAIYRFWSEQKQGHFFTIDEFEKNSIMNNDKSWKAEGTAFYGVNATNPN